MRRPLCLICLLFVLSVMLFMTVFSERLLKKALPNNHEPGHFVGEVTDIKLKENTSSLILKSKKDGVAVLCYTSQDINNLKIGNSVLATGKVRLFERATNDGEFDAERYYSALGIDYALTNCTISVKDAKYAFVKEWLRHVRLRLEKHIDMGMRKREAGVLKAMLLGDKIDLDAEVKGLYQRNGIAHIIAISGLHISLLGMGFYKMLKRMRMASWLSFLLSFLFVVSYGYMTGSQASAVRSIIMFLLYLLAEVVNKTYDMPTAMAISAACLLVMQPYYAFHTGFILSFLAVLGISVFTPSVQFLLTGNDYVQVNIVEETNAERLKSKMVRFLLASASASVGVTLASLPAQLSFFFTFPIYSVFLNIIIAPLVGILLFMGLLGALFMFFAHPLAKVCFFVCHLILTVYENVGTLFDRLPFAHPVIAKPTILQILVYVVCMLLFWRFCYPRTYLPGEKRMNVQKKKIYGCVCVLIGIGSLCAHVRTQDALYMIDVGQGDCFLLEEKGGCNFLIDSGSSSVDEVAKYKVEPMLKSHGIKKIDYVFLSHADADHTNGILQMLENQNTDKIEIGYLLLTELAKDNEDYYEILEAAKRAETKIGFMDEGDEICVGNVSFRCLLPRAGESSQTIQEENDRSMVLLMSCLDTTILFTGDLSENRERELMDRLARYCPQKRIDILKVAHHGSKYSTTKELLSQIRPRIGLISAGRNNSYGHPHKETMDRLADVRCIVESTATDGMTVIKFYRRRFTVHLPCRSNIDVF